VPTLTAATLFAVQLLRDNMRFAREHGVPKAQVLRFAVAAYNAGAGGALTGFRSGNVDRNTANHNYSTDVLARAQVVARFLKRHGLST
jgi:soluble lytic murein transglycosylase-like protein